MGHIERHWPIFVFRHKHFIRNNSQMFYQSHACQNALEHCVLLTFVQLRDISRGTPQPSSFQTVKHMIWLSGWKCTHFTTHWLLLTQCASHLNLYFCFPGLVFTATHSEFEDRESDLSEDGAHMCTQRVTSVTFWQSCVPLALIKSTFFQPLLLSGLLGFSKGKAIFFCICSFVI